MSDIDNPPSPASLKLTESLRHKARELQEAEITIDEFLQAFATAIGQIELPEKREKLSLTKFPFAAGQADGWNDMREVCQAVIEDFKKGL